MTPKRLARLAQLQAMTPSKWPDVRQRLAAELAELQAEHDARPPADRAALLERARARALELGVRA